VDEALPAEQVRTLSAFRSRDFRLLWSGQTISFVGDAAFLVALGWRVTDLTGAGSLGFVLSLYSLGLLTTLLWGGVLADRHSRRLLMIGSDLGRAVLVGAFAVAEVTGHLSMPVVLALATRSGSRTGSSTRRSAGSSPSSWSSLCSRRELAHQRRPAAGGGGRPGDRGRALTASQGRRRSGRSTRSRSSCPPRFSGARGRDRSSPSRGRARYARWRRGFAM
jgi:hypothetical protein